MVTRAQAKIKSPTANEDTIDQVLNEYLMADDDDDLELTKQVIFEDTVKS